MSIPTTSEAPPAPSYYNCDFVDKLPYKGTEILTIAGIFMFIILNFSVDFFGLIAKQLWPSLLDPVVANRVAMIQRMFPGLGSRTDDEDEYDNENNEEEDDDDMTPKKKKPFSSSIYSYTHPVTGQAIEYDSVCAQEAYISGKSIDEDLILTLANNYDYGTVSEYCACTTRGYVMLSTMLMTSGMCLSFMAIHNQMVDPTQGGILGTISLAGYSMCFLTGMTMTSVGPPPVFRNANIWLTTNMPMSGEPKKFIKLHTLGIVSFCLVPMICHLLYALGNKDKMPNYGETMTGIAGQLLGAIAFGVMGVLPKYVPSFSKKDSNKYGIAAELAVVFASFLAFINYEYYATASCAGHVNTWHAILLFCMVAPFGFVVRHSCWAPTSFTSPPSLVLMKDKKPVATVGPCPAVSFNDSTFNPDGLTNCFNKELPRIKFDPEDMKM